MLTLRYIFDKKNCKKLSQKIFERIQTRKEQEMRNIEQLSAKVTNNRKQLAVYVSLLVLPVSEEAQLW